MFNLIFSSQIPNALGYRIEGIFQRYYAKIRQATFLSAEPVEILVHYSSNGILDGEANMLQRYLVFHVNDNFTTDKFLILLAHELFHISHYDFFGETESNIDSIVDEGMALLVEESVKNNFQLRSPTQPEIWKKKMNQQEIINLLHKANTNDSLFDENWWTLLHNNNLENKNFADNSIYQIGYWLVKKVIEKSSLTFEEAFFKDKKFWNDQVNKILKEAL